MKRLDVCDLGRCRYSPVLRLQERLVERRLQGDIPDTLLLLEHEPVYTLGRNADEGNLLLSAEKCRERGIDVVRIGRGGDVTFHGPGQLVGYPIFDLRSRGRRVLWYVNGLEELLIRTLGDFGITGRRDSINRGVWVGEKKIAAIGVRVTRFIAMHGFSLNVDPDLSFYEGIVPCGIRDRGVTTIRDSLGKVDKADVRRRLVERCVDVFGFEHVTWIDEETIEA